MWTIPFFIPLEVNPFFLVVAFFIAYLSSGNVFLSVVGTGVIFVSIFIHELGHALTAMLFRQKVKISFLPFGGLTERDGEKINKWQEFLIILNGPIAGISLFYLCYYLYPYTETFNNQVLNYAMQFAILINLYWTILNLVPVLPLDGGQLVRVILESLFGARGMVFSALFSLVIGLLITVFFFLTRNFFAGSLFALFAMESWRLYVHVRHMTDTDQNDDLKNSYNKALKEYESGDLDSSLQQFKRVAEESQQGVIHTLSLYKLAEIETLKKDYQKAYAILSSLKGKLKLKELPLLQRLAFETKRYQEALDIGIELARENADVNTALINSLSSAYLNEPEKAKNWFKNYINLGGDKNVLNDHRFQILRTLFKTK